VCVWCAWCFSSQFYITTMTGCVPDVTDVIREGLTKHHTLPKAASQKPLNYEYPILENITLWKSSVDCSSKYHSDT